MYELSRAEKSFPIEYLSSDKVTALFMHGISHAQSCTVLFRGIFEYIHALHPEYRVARKIETFQNVLARKNRPLIYAHLPPKEYEDPWVESGLDYQAYIMWQELNKRPPWPERNRSVIVRVLAGAISWEDWHYLKDRRHVKQPALALDYNIRESIPSYLCYYGFDKHSTGLSELDQMYADVSAHIRTKCTALEKHGVERPAWYDIVQEVIQLHDAEITSGHTKKV